MSQKPVEFQIRTQSMHRKAQFGIAAHWLYKDEEEARLEGERQLQWLRSLLTQREKATSHADFVECLRLQSVEDRPLIFSKAGRQVQIPEDVTVEESTSQTKEMAGHAAPLADGAG